MSELSGFVYIKNHAILHVKSKAQKVNYWSYYITSDEWGKKKRPKYEWPAGKQI